MIKDKRCFIRIQNNDNLCLARAVVTAKARIDGHDQWNSIRQGRNIQKVLAVQLHEKTGVPLTKCGIEEAKHFKNVLKDYQINILSKEHFNGIIFSGPETEKRLYIYHHDDHFDVITSMAGFLCKNYYCVRCKTGYDHVSKHRCNNPCASCHHVHDDGEENSIHCEDCNRYFRNNHCFDRHKMTTISGKSTCKTHYKCKICSQLINTSMHKKPHKCGESYCRTCRDFFYQDHKCYMIPVNGQTDVSKDKSFEEDVGKKKSFIFFDFDFDF